MNDRLNLNPPAEVRQHTQRNFVDEYGDTWDETGTIKIAHNAKATLERQDAVRKQIRADLDAQGLRDNLGTIEIEVDGERVSIEGPSAAFHLRDEMLPTPENIERLERKREIARLHDLLFEQGALPDIALINIDRALELGVITRNEHRWLKVKFAVRRFIKKLLRKD